MPNFNPEDDFPPPKADFSAPPPYEVAINNEATSVNSTDQCFDIHSKLPTYEEVQREKNLNGEPTHGVNINTRADNLGQGAQPRITFIAIETPNESETNVGTDNSLLGTDSMFILAFAISFIFNWIGFLMLTCFCNTIASRYGALSGFGLSLAKWTFIVKNSTDLASHENSWLWWLVMAFGFLICVRALVQYISIKRTWRLLSASAQERLLFFY